MFSQQPFQSIQKQEILQSQLEEYRNFLQNKVQEVDINTNSVLSRIGEYFFDCSSIMKSDIILRLKKGLSFSSTFEDLQESIYLVEQSVNTFMFKQKDIYAYTQNNLQKYLNPLHFFNSTQEKDIPTKSNQENQFSSFHFQDLIRDMTKDQAKKILQKQFTQFQFLGKAPDQAQNQMKNTIKKQHTFQSSGKEKAPEKQTQKNNQIHIQSNNDDQSLFQRFDDQQVFRTECPVCYKLMSNSQTFVKHLRLHDIDLLSQGYDCPSCDATFSQSDLLLTHLYRRHYEILEYKQNRRKTYFCPFTQQKFPQRQSNQLANVIRSSPHYSKALQQLQEHLLIKKQKNDIPSEELKLQIKQKMPNQPNYDVEFIRGVTKGIQINKRLYACPLCGLEEFNCLKYVGGHIRNAHRVKFRNNLYCPQCQIETRYAHNLATHLINTHGIVEELSEGGRRQVYTTLGGIQFDDFTKLSQYLNNDEEYLTFFNSKCPDQPIGLLKIKDNENQGDLNQMKEDIS